jgi:opacity protein-like surface antigen
MFHRGMRPFLAILLLIMAAAIVAGTAQADEKQFYVGIGGSYMFPNFDYDEVVDWDSDAWGANAKFGYRLAHTLYLQADVDYFFPIDGVLKTDASIGGEVEIFTGMISLKGYFPQFTVIRPFVIAGAGIMHYKVSYNDAAKTSGFPLPDDNETDLCFKVGGGVDFFINDVVSLGIEGNYTRGVEDVDEVEYIHIGTGVNVYF